VLSLRKNLGNEDASTLSSMNQVGLVLDDQGKYEEAEAMHRQTLVLRKKILSKEYPNILTSINNLVLVLDSQGKYEEARAIHR
jgi:Flp pilus assembly protein TadD